MSGNDLTSPNLTGLQQCLETLCYQLQKWIETTIPDHLIHK